MFRVCFRVGYVLVFALEPFASFSVGFRASLGDCKKLTKQGVGQVLQLRKFSNLEKRNQ